MPHRRLLELLIEATPAAIAIFDTDMKYIGVSEKWRNDYDIEDDDLIGKCHYQGLRP